MWKHSVRPREGRSSDERREEGEKGERESKESSIWLGGSGAAEREGYGSEGIRAIMIGVTGEATADPCRGEDMVRVEKKNCSLALVVKKGGARVKRSRKAQRWTERMPVGGAGIWGARRSGVRRWSSCTGSASVKN